MSIFTPPPPHEITKSISKVSKRIDYLDYVKGLCIVWVIWFHALHPSFVSAYYHVPLFFFISGFFLKKDNTKDFVKKRIKQLIVPYCFFYVIYYPLWMITYVWDHRTLTGFNWESIIYIFNIASDEFTSWNGPLWFLFVLFWVNLFVFFVYKSNYHKILLAGIVFVVSLFYDVLSENSITNYFVYLGYYSLGVLLGKKLILYLESEKKMLLLLSCSLYIALYYLSSRIEINYVHGLIYSCMLFSFFVGVISLFSFFDKKCMKIFSWFGRNSIIVLGMHWWFATVFFSRIFKVFFHYEPPIWTGLVNTVMTAIVLSCVIPFFNKYCRMFIGK